MANKTVLVRVPATSANLGPGFDSIGVALDWTIDVRVTATDAATPRPEGPIERMVASAVLSLYARAGVEPPAGLLIDVSGDIPVGRGMGVSAAARIAGLLAANEMLPGSEERTGDMLLALATQLERHADNAAPALLGGLQVVVADDEDVAHVTIQPPTDLRIALLIPEFSMPTEESREKLPTSLTRNQAVHNIGRAAMLIAALTQHRYDLLTTATEDVLHQPARATIFTAMYPIFQAARDAGAMGVFLSGGGPTIAAFAQDNAEDVAGAMREAAAAHGVEASTRVVNMRAAGAEVIELG
jgi:homoserine kinase